MNLVRLLLLALMFLPLVGCKEKPPAQSLPDVYDGGDSVYGNGGSADGTTGETLESDEISSDGFSPSFEEDDVDVSSLDDFSGQTLSEDDLNWAPILFSFDESSLSEDAKRRLKDHAQQLINNPRLQVLLEGHCDTRGTEDYNLALGERRAQAVKRYLTQLGVPEARLKTMSYGEMRPLVPGESETAWSQNRRVSFTF